jgi:hypothetical protein
MNSQALEKGILDQERYIVLSMPSQHTTLHPATLSDKTDTAIKRQRARDAKTKPPRTRAAAVAAAQGKTLMSVLSMRLGWICRGRGNVSCYYPN